MSDYTPTTEEVREGYSAEYEGCNCENCHYDRIRFDRWFAEVIRKAKADGFDEGWDARVNAETITPTENPYRQGETK